MTAESFIKILKAFADRPDDIESVQGEFLIQVQNDVLAFRTRLVSGSLSVIEDDREQSAEDWIADRLANLPQLARNILDYIPKEEYYIEPWGTLTKVHSEYENGGDDNRPLISMHGAVTDYINDYSGIGTAVLYITSEAGEGKTTFIDHLTREYARNYIDRKHPERMKLIVPIQLGGRSFLRLDDMVVGYIANRLRFRRFYYEGFLELVKLGFIIPAFDGFEELFVRGIGGEAVSALGSLISELDSTGILLVAARKAYYEISNFVVQARIMDSLDGKYAYFDHLTVRKWSKKQFTEYLGKRAIADPDAVYTSLTTLLRSEDHPVVTRAMLVRRIADLLEQGFTAEIIFESNTTSYFREIIDASIKREINEKWLTQDDIPKPILSLEEHYNLLAEIANEMQTSNTSVMTLEGLNIVTKLFCEKYNIEKSMAEEIVRRVKDYPLLRLLDQRSKLFSFDHEEYRNFFIGVNIYNILLSATPTILRSVLKASSLAQQSLDTVVLYLREKDGVIERSLDILYDTYTMEMSYSYVKENIEMLVAMIFRGSTVQNRQLEQMNIPMDVFEGTTLRNMVFDKCIFINAVISGTSLHACRFNGCEIDAMTIKNENKVNDTFFYRTKVYQLLSRDNREHRDPGAIEAELQRLGVVTLTEEHERTTCDPVQEEELIQTVKVLHIFMRTTTIYMDKIEKALGVKANTFVRNVLPVLLSEGILKDVKLKSGTKARQLQLSVRMAEIDNAVRESKGCFKEFVRVLRNKNV